MRLLNSRTVIIWLSFFKIEDKERRFILDINIGYLEFANKILFSYFLHRVHSKLLTPLLSLSRLFLVRRRTF